MRKQLIPQVDQEVSPPYQGWLDLEKLARVELTSEDPSSPIEFALVPGAGMGWRAAQAGRQTIRLIFDKSQDLGRIQLLFYEERRARTQEFVLRWSADGGRSYQEVVRQQYNFSPPGMTSEFEDYVVNLAGVTTLELTIIPDISGGDARASIGQLRIAQ
jgi:hypothetical protein